MTPYMKKTARAALTLALAAAVAAASAGCRNSGAHSSSAPSEQAAPASPAASEPAPAVTEPTPPETADAADSAATAATAEAAAAADTAATAVSADTAATAATADTAATAAVAEDAADTSAEAAEAAGTADTAAASAATGETAGENATAGSTDAEAAALQAGVPARDGAVDTALMESVLSEALVSCTGWGQSAGSSLRAASAAARLLRWANQAEAGRADADALDKAVDAEINRLSPDQLSNLKSNWSFVSYDADIILDEFDEIAGMLEDAGCLETAREAAADPDALSNWKAASKALNRALK